jgi:hypothetical protein
MQRTSDSIGTLAAALARAQGELVNPEKSLVATIRADARGGGERTFRYAPLSSGLDIVRKILGQHEIATVQTTSIDQTAGLINLTTVLAHASGEWVASDWPVCAITETEKPHRMGAALTYARRYALFTLVGIAGEDDLDAPDLVTSTNPTSQPEKPQSSGKGQLNGGQQRPAQRSKVQRNARTHPQISEPILEAEASADLRDRLIAELTDLGSSDDAAMWAHRCLSEKNRLTAADAQRVEESFQAKLASFATPVEEISEAVGSTASPVAPLDQGAGWPKYRTQADVINKALLALPEPRRVRDRVHLKWVANQPCLICGRRPSDAHHLRYAQHPALGRKVSDEFTVPLCRGHHREVHHCGDEAAWWAKVGVDPIAAARTLWLKTHPLPVASEKTQILTTQSAGRR